MGFEIAFIIAVIAKKIVQARKDFSSKLKGIEKKITSIEEDYI